MRLWGGAGSVIPAADQVQQTVTIGSSVVRAATLVFGMSTTHVWWQVIGADVRLTVDNATDPTSSVGFVAKDGESGIWSLRMFRQTRFLRQASTDAALIIQELRGDG